MGQYYKLIILANDKKNNKEVILLVLNPRDYNLGSKLMEHSYIGTDIMNTLEYLISPNGQFHQSRIVWAGDYADEEDNYDDPQTLYQLADNYSSYTAIYEYNKKNKYIINHTKKIYIDKEKIQYNEIHPLPLLVSEGNGRGGGDYNGNNQDLCGSWNRDVISMEESLPFNYIELIPEFKE